MLSLLPRERARNSSWMVPASATLIRLKDGRLRFILILLQGTGVTPRKQGSSLSPNSICKGNRGMFPEQRLLPHICMYTYICTDSRGLLTWQQLLPQNYMYLYQIPASVTRGCNHRGFSLHLYLLGLPCVVAMTILLSWKSATFPLSALAVWVTGGRHQGNGFT